MVLAEAGERYAVLRLWRIRGTGALTCNVLEAPPVTWEPRSAERVWPVSCPVWG
jgi:hypothetical protein